MNLFRNNKPIPTMFDLLGSNENDMTAALAFVLASSSNFLTRMVAAITGGKRIRIEEALVKIQTVSSFKGITDIEISCGRDFFAVIEAKRGPTMPGHQQLNKYIPILRGSRAEHRYLVTVSNATLEFAAMHFESPLIQGIPLIHLPWRQIRKMAVASFPGETNSNKQLLKQFVKYLGEILGMEQIYSNMVYVVSLGQGSPDGWKLSWIDIVEKKNLYFYPIGNRWPDPPNYLGFRYAGQLQSIRKVESFTTFIYPRDAFSEAVDIEWPPHYCFTLGKPIVPPHAVKNGVRIVRSARCWCMLDLLLTSKTISDALTETEKRVKANA